MIISCHIERTRAVVVNSDAKRSQLRIIDASVIRDAAPRSGSDQRRPEDRSSVSSSERSEVAEWPEMRQLVGVDDRVDAGDLTAGDLERDHGDQPLLCVKEERARVTVDLDGAQRRARKARAQAGPVDQGGRDTAAAAQRARQGGNLAAAVAGQLHVVGEQRLQPRQVALLDGPKESSCQLFALLARGLEAGAALLDVASGAGGELPDVVLALADD